MLAKNLLIGIGILVPALIGMGTVISPANLQSANAAKSLPSLTGVYNCDDGGQYYVTQIGNTLWWAGLSGGGDGHSFTNVYKAMIKGGGKTIFGEWADVPRGGILNHGHLQLTVVLSPSGQVVGLHKTNTGEGFVGIDWQKIS